MTLMGTAQPRIDGPLKVTGAARYAAEHRVADALYAVLVPAATAKGRIGRIDAEAARAAPGVAAILTHEDMPAFGALPQYIQPLDPTFAAQSWLPLQGVEVTHQGQPVAVALADSFERATHAAALVEVAYEGVETPKATLAQAMAAGHAPGEPHPHSTCLPKRWSHASRDDGGPYEPHDIIGEGADYDRGDVEAGMGRAEHRLELRYVTPIHHHNPMEMHATIAEWGADGSLTVHDSSNAVFGCQNALATALEVPVGKVRVIAPFVGGGFGGKGRMWPHVALCAAAARIVGRPVKLMLARRDLYFGTGHRPEMVQTVRVGARADGTLTALAHDTLQETWAHENYAEPTGAMSRMMYACPNFSMTHRVVHLDTPKANMMHAPGEGVGSFATECMMDELAEAVGLDPLELRRRNFAEVDPTDDRPFSSNGLRACYDRGAALFGWEGRPLAPRSMTRDGMLVGWGMAAAEYPAFYRQPASARAVIHEDGSLQVEAGTADFGTGTYTMLAVVAADAMGLPLDRVEVRLGDTVLPHSPQQVASLTTASVGPAVAAACGALRANLIGIARGIEGSPLAEEEDDRIEARDGGLRVRDGNAGMSYPEILRGGGSPFARLAQVEAAGSAAPGAAAMKHAMYSFGAHFCEVRVDPVTGEVQVPRWVTAAACGRIVNRRAATSQIHGGLIWGIGHALMEQTLTDPATARYANTNLLEYHLADHMDPPSDIRVEFLDEDDPHINDLGAKCVGELGKVGTIPAVVNAIWHATGVRVRELPASVDKLMGG